MTTPNIPVESPLSPMNLGQLLNDLVDKQQDTLTQSQIVQKQTLTRAIDYIHKTKTVINTLHEIIELHKEVQKQQRELLKHCLVQLENPKPRNQDLIVKAIKQHLEKKQ
jgi:hypothetical protein